MTAPTDNFTLLWVCSLAFAILLIILLSVYVKHQCTLRNESEYKDIMEYQTMLVGALLFYHPNLLPVIHKLRYFPDESGFFMVLNFQEQVLAHGDFSGDLSKPKEYPFMLPVSDMVEAAKLGGGYIKHNYKGHLYEFFVYAYPGSPFIVCSALCSDAYHIKRRSQWRRVDRTLIRRQKKN